MSSGFSDNHAERMIRPAVLWRRTSQDAATILSTVQTCRLQARSALAVLEDVVRAAWTEALMPSLLPQNV